jgi:hypothetical protein
MGSAFERSHRFTRPQLRLLGLGNVAAFQRGRDTEKRSLRIANDGYTVPSFKSLCPTKTNQMIQVGKIVLDTILEIGR